MHPVRRARGHAQAPGAVGGGGGVGQFLIGLQRTKQRGDGRARDGGAVPVNDPALQGAGGGGGGHLGTGGKHQQTQQRGSQ